MRFDVLVVWSCVFVLLFGIAYTAPASEVAVPPVTETSKLLALTGYFSESMNFEELAAVYRNRVHPVLYGEPVLAAPERVRVLIVPGHDDNHVGAQFNGVREVDINRALAAHIARAFADNDAFEVLVASNNKGWHPLITQFLQDNAAKIASFEQLHKEATQKLEPVLNVYDNPDIEQHDVERAVAETLYGINKFANDGQFDIVLHVHFNDYPGRPKKRAGKYEGFAIYVPAAQLSNGRASQRLARHIFSELSSVRPVSTLPVESEGIIEDSELIAIGAFNTVKAAAVLIEYGFIYEPDIINPETQQETFIDLAHATVRGVEQALQAVR